MRADRASVEHGRLIFPLAQGIHGGLLQKRRAGKDFHCGHPAVFIDKGVNFHIARDMLGFRQRSVGGLHRGEEPRRNGIASYSHGSFWSGRLAAGTGEIRAHRCCGRQALFKRRGGDAVL